MSFMNIEGSNLNAGASVSNDLLVGNEKSKLFLGDIDEVREGREEKKKRR